MSLSGKQTINIGLPNESVGSDSLYTAFTKINNNFDTVFSNASPYNTFTAGAGIDANANATSGTLTITNTGVTAITAGTNIVIDSSNGNVTISATGGNGGGGGTVTSVGLQAVSNTRLTISGTPIISSGNIAIDLAPSGVTPATYSNPTFAVDNFGRITSASNGSSSGTVTSVGLTAGSGIQVNGGPITSNGNMTVTNTGVIRINAGSGITVSSGNGNVTISTLSLGGTVTSVGVTSSQLVIANSPVVSSGTISVDLPNSVTFSGNITGGNANIGGLMKSATGNVTGNLAAGNANIVASATIGTFMKLTPGTAPGTPAEGMVYYDAASHVLKYYNGSTWRTITSS